MNLSINSETLEGVLTFDGYYYIDDSELPKKLMMSYRNYDKKLCGECMQTWRRGDCMEALDADIEIYRREKLKETSVSWPDVDEDGEEMNICLFPTDIQKIYFKVLNIIKDDRLPSPPVIPNSTDE
jgi:hypothetical protein